MVRSRSRLRIIGALIAAAAAIVLAGCAHAGYLSLSSSEATIPACSQTQRISVADLNSDAEPACEPLGSVLVFPSGAELKIDEQAGGGSQKMGDDPVRYSWVSVGNFGIVAGEATDTCGKHHVWGGRSAIERVKQAFGDDWPCS